MTSDHWSSKPPTQILCSVIVVLTASYIGSFSVAFGRSVPRHRVGRPAAEIAGIAAARAGDDGRAQLLLQRALDGGDGSSLVKRYLSYVWAYRGQYKEAARLGQQALQSPNFDLRGNDLAQFKQDVAFWRAIQRIPPQRTTLNGLAKITLLSDTGGRVEAIVLAAGKTVHALFDTGAEYAVLSQSTAAKLGVHLLPATIKDVGSTGQQNAMHVGWLPNMKLGSVYIRNIPVMIAADAAMKVGPPAHQKDIDLIVGYSILRTVGTFSVVAGKTIVLNDRSSESTVSALLREDGFVPVISAMIMGEPAELVLDSGANHTIFSSAFYAAHHELFSAQSIQSQAFAGIGGSARVRSYHLCKVELKFDRGTAQLENPAVFPGASQFDVAGLVGNMGRDLWANYRRVTFNFRRHRLELSNTP